MLPHPHSRPGKLPGIANPSDIRGGDGICRQIEVRNGNPLQNLADYRCLANLARPDENLKEMSRFLKP
jgi:hypothetical protein